MNHDEEAKELQRALANIDLMTRPSRGEGHIELLLLRHLPLKIKMYKESNHTRPHIHIDYGDTHHAASYAIDDGSRLAGYLDGKYDSAIQRWIAKWNEPLREVWDRTQEGSDTEAILSELRASKL